MLSRIIGKAVLFVGLYATAMPCYCEINQVSAEKLSAMLGVKMDTVTVVDVRGSYDFQKGHIPGAISAPYNVVDKAVLPKDYALVLYCGNDKCPLSQFAAKTLVGLGYKNISVLTDGITGWIAKGYAVETAAGVEQKKAPLEIEPILPDKLRTLLKAKTVGVIDVRPVEEFRIAHLPGAKNIPIAGLATASAVLDKDAQWVICGRSGADVNTAGQLLAGKGFKVKELSGGIAVWAAKKYPLETGN